MMRMRGKRDKIKGKEKKGREHPNPPSSIRTRLR
jgi:hypothetical protein